MTDAQQYQDEGASAAQVAIQRISLELRTPLTVVIGFCELLASERPDDASIEEFATRISTNAWQLHTAVERLIAELGRADVTGPPSHHAFQWTTDPGAADPG